MEKVNRYSKLNFSFGYRPDTVSCPGGKPIYEWEYLDQTGKLKKDKKNVYEEIQSYKDSVDYKKLIKEHEDLTYGIRTDDLFMDTTIFSGDIDGVARSIAGVADDIRQAVANGQKSEATKTVGEVGQQSATTPQASGTVVEQQPKQGGEQQ